MYVQLQKAKRDSNRAAAIQFSSRKNRVNQGFSFVDNRSTIIQQKGLIQAADSRSENTTSDSGISKEEESENTSIAEVEYADNETEPMTFDLVRTEEDAETDNSEESEEPAQRVAYYRGRRTGRVRYYETRGRRDRHVQWHGHQHHRNHVTYVHRDGGHSHYWPETNSFIIRRGRYTRRRLLRLLRHWERQYGQRL